MSQFRSTPTYEQPLVQGSNTSSVWYRYFQANDTGQPPNKEAAVTLTASPSIFTTTRKGFVIVNGGTVSAIAISRSGTYYVTGQTVGTFNLSQGDMLKITYTVKPTVTFFPT